MFSGIDQPGLFILAGLLLNLTPGPDVLYIVSNGVRGGLAGPHGWRTFPLFRRPACDG